MFDKIEIIGKSTIQHGKSNNRIYLLKLNPDDVPDILPELDRLANQHGYTKIFTKIQADALPGFLLNGYKTEAFVPGFYNGKTDCIMASKFLDNERKRMPEAELKLFMELFALKGKNNNNILASKLNIRALTEKDAVAITKVFKRVFETYPFPVHDPDYILKTMKLNHARYFGIWDNDKLIGVSTAETDFEKENAEMTDFAVLPAYRGKSLALHLLNFMEKKMKTAGIKTAYTIARLAEPGMNLTFMKAGYRFSGTLINNTNIGGRIESMNIFYKQLFF
jgi:beta-lysine N6-acetyltransferase